MEGHCPPSQMIPIESNPALKSNLSICLWIDKLLVHTLTYHWDFLNVPLHRSLIQPSCENNYLFHLDLTGALSGLNLQPLPRVLRTCTLHLQVEENPALKQLQVQRKAFKGRRKPDPPAHNGVKRSSMPPGPTMRDSAERVWAMFCNIWCFRLRLVR